jgi:glycosyltransferase involved in cell wall biosynthesis
MSLNILAPVGYPWRFNGPRHSRHTIVNRLFVPMNKVNFRWEGVTCMNPWNLPGFDLVHGYNRIPIGVKPYVIGFESHLPRAFTLERSRYFAWLRGSLAGRRCRRIIASSHNAALIFRTMHIGSAEFEALNAKLEVRYPSYEVGPMPALKAMHPNEPIRICFVGRHFARKGGCVAVRLAEMAHERGLPLQISIASALEMGRGVWTDPQRPGYFDRWRAGLEHPYIRYFPHMPNAEVVQLMADSHFSLLTTFGDTFGYSAIESMAKGTPVIATAQGALPEFINAENGIMLDLPTNDVGEWIHSNVSARDTAPFEAMFTDEIERLASETLSALIRLVEEPIAYRAMQEAARHTAANLFDSHAASDYWDSLYEEVTS